MNFVFKIIKYCTRIINGFMEHNRNMKLWNKSDSISASMGAFDGHVLVVKDSKYAQVAQICIASFLHFHPNARITIHCDTHTFKSMRKKSKFGIHNQSVKVMNDQPKNKTWQELKIELALGMQNTDQFLMDADLKWNGSLGILDGITFFVREFTFKENDLYRQLFADMDMSSQLNNSMKNTSFFSWNGRIYGDGAAEQFSTLRKKICSSASQLEITSEEKASVFRISEQLAISLLIKDEEAKYIKARDVQFDGEFVESSYFGATGTRFGRFGITSRRYG